MPFFPLGRRHGATRAPRPPVVVAPADAGRARLVFAGLVAAMLLASLDQMILGPRRTPAC